MKTSTMIALKSEFSENTVNLYDRPGSHEVARLREETSRTIDAIDTPADMLAEALNDQLAKYKGPLPNDRESLRAFILEQFHSAAGPTAISAMSGAQTALTFQLNLATSSASALLSGVHSSPMWAELLWDGATATTAGFANKAQVAGTIKTGYLGVGVPFLG